MKTTLEQPALLAHSLREAARRTGIPLQTFQSPRWRRRVGLTITRVGRRVLILDADLVELLRRGREPASGGN